MIRRRRIDENVKCRDCDMKVFCQGGCFVTSLKKTDTIQGCYCELWDSLRFLEYIDMGM